MAEELQRAQSELVYMVTGEDKSGDTTISVTADRRRAEKRLKAMLATYASVKANWLERGAGPRRQGR